MALMLSKKKGVGGFTGFNIIQSYTLPANTTVTSLDIDVDPKKTYVFAIHNYQSEVWKPIAGIISNGVVIWGNPSNLSVTNGKLTGGTYSSTIMYVDWTELT